ncbi:unnamed protein product [Effrenium voratum]|nr:unnamed protein product [Effrenium voratum]
MASGQAIGAGQPKGPQSIPFRFAGAVFARDLQDRDGMEHLRSTFRLPPSWSVECMVRGEGRLLAKREVTEPKLLRLFDGLVRSTALPSVRTRDRRGAVPRSFRAVRAVQIMNAGTWSSYARRRDVVAQDCAKLKARTDGGFWRDRLNGELLTAELTAAHPEVNAAEPLVPAANEVWLFHGTSHDAAEGITTDDFDLTKANPSGAFDAEGLSFSPCCSAAFAARMHEGGQSCGLACLGYVYYCEDRRPSARHLEETCQSVGGKASHERFRGQEWHSVLGDRKKTSGTFREFIIYDNLQAFPAYIVAQQKPVYYAREF